MFINLITVGILSKISGCAKRALKVSSTEIIWSRDPGPRVVVYDAVQKYILHSFVELSDKKLLSCVRFNLGTRSLTNRQLLTIS